MAEIVMSSVTKRFGDGAVAVDDLDLEIRDGEFMVLVGPSGCGKTTALRMVAGLETLSEGEIRIGGRVVNDLQPRQRDIAMVFQNYALYPHMSVYENMAFGLELAKISKDDIDRRVKKAAQVLGLEDFLKRKPRALSGGQRQRVAMGRAIVREPQAFLMDEPLSNLDAKLRVQMRSEIARIQSELGVTTIYVTHDQVEAMTMGDRVAVLRRGRLQQVGTPRELFDRPRNLFVAGFIGTPSMNFVSSRLDKANGHLQVQIGDQPIDFDEPALAGREALKDYVGKEVIVGIRPQDFEDASLESDAPRACRLKVHVDLVEAIGTETIVHFAVNAPVPMTEDMKDLAADVGAGDLHKLSRAAEHGRNEFVAELDPRTEIHKGQDAELVVDTANLHFFDPETNRGIYDG